jgi:hypothetical protein
MHTRTATVRRRAPRGAGALPRPGAEAAPPPGRPWSPSRQSPLPPPGLRETNNKAPTFRFATSLRKRIRRFCVGARERPSSPLRIYAGEEEAAGFRAELRGYSIGGKEYWREPVGLGTLRGICCLLQDLILAGQSPSDVPSVQLRPGVSCLFFVFS